MGFCFPFYLRHEACNNLPILESLSNDRTATATKTSLKSRCCKLYSAYSILFNSSNVGNFFCIKSSIKHFHVVAVQRRLRNVQKSVTHVQSCCFVNLNLLVFLRSRCRRRRRCLSSLLAYEQALHLECRAK